MYGDGCRIKDIDPEEHARFVAFADNADNWRGADAFSILVWDVPSEGGSTITFYRIT
jgi:hypothetical protein